MSAQTQPSQVWRRRDDGRRENPGTRKPAMAEWPHHPTPGDSVRLPLALAPMLLEALGYAAGWTT